jgi:hypothetical protein
MNLKVYYQKLRQTESDISEPFVIVVSQETPDGGRAGVLTETPRRIAARMILEGTARLANEDEAAAFREEIQERKRQAEQAAVASRLQVTVVSEGDLKKPGAHQKGLKSH